MRDGRQPDGLAAVACDRSYDGFVTQPWLLHLCRMLSTFDIPRVCLLAEPALLC